MTTQQVVLFTGGGSAGHVHPGLAIISRLLTMRDDIDIWWMGSKHGIEGKMVADADIPFYAIPCGKLRRYFSLHNVSDGVRTVVGILVALMRLARLSVAVVFSKGGYVTVPVVIAAWVLRIPVISHESDITPGLATRINGRFSARICLAHEYGRRYLPGTQREKAVVSGNPVRQLILQGSSRRGWQFIDRHLTAKTATHSAGAPRRGVQQRPVVLVMGGSLGAHQINQLVSATGRKLIQDHRCIIVHQTGRHLVSTPELERDPQYIAVPYIAAEIGDLIALATVVVSRAGANILWECATRQKAMVLVPLSAQNSRGDQIVNAELFGRHDAAMVLSRETGWGARARAKQSADGPAQRATKRGQSERSARGHTKQSVGGGERAGGDTDVTLADALLTAVGTLLTDRQKRVRMGKRAGSLVTTGAADHLAQIVSEMLESRS